MRRTRLSHLLGKEEAAIPQQEEVGFGSGVLLLSSFSLLSLLLLFAHLLYLRTTRLPTQTHLLTQTHRLTQIHLLASLTTVDIHYQLPRVALTLGNLETLPFSGKTLPITLS